MFIPGKLTDSSGGAASATIAAGTNLDTLTDSTGGTPGTTFAAITAPGANATTSLSADMAAVKNALASTAAELALQKALNTVLLNGLASAVAKINSLVDTVKGLS